MKKLLYLLSITFLLLQSCSSGSDSNNNITTSNVDYEFTVVFDGIVYKVKGNTAKDSGNKGPTVNNCIAKRSQELYFSIQDVTYHNYVSGNPFECFIDVKGNFISGTNIMNVKLYFNGYPYSFYRNKGACYGCNSGEENSLLINITDLGTPLTGTLGTSNVIFGNTIKGSYKGVVYTIPQVSTKATVPHNLSIDFIAVRQY